MHFNPGWVPYDEREAYLVEADLGVCAHHDHLEARFSFRTRVLDHFWAGLPSVLTGGDAMGELVERRGLGARDRRRRTTPASRRRARPCSTTPTTTRRRAARVREAAAGFRWSGRPSRSCASASRRRSGPSATSAGHPRAGDVRPVPRRAGRPARPRRPARGGARDPAARRAGPAPPGVGPRRAVAGQRPPRGGPAAWPRACRAPRGPGARPSGAQAPGAPRAAGAGAGAARPPAAGEDGPGVPRRPARPRDRGLLAQRLRARRAQRRSLRRRWTPSTSRPSASSWGYAKPVDVVAPGHELPLPRRQLRLRARLARHRAPSRPDRRPREWLRVSRRYVVLVVPHRDRTFDRDRPLTPVAELVERHRSGFTSDEDRHWSVWTAETSLELCERLGLRRPGGPRPGHARAASASPWCCPRRPPTSPDAPARHASAGAR